MSTQLSPLISPLPPSPRSADDGSGETSVYTEFQDHEVMFHVSTLLQYDETDAQRVQRKRFIGNDIVVIVFMDGETTYHAETMKSEYTSTGLGCYAIFFLCACFCLC